MALQGRAAELVDCFGLAGRDFFDVCFDGAGVSARLRMPMMSFGEISKSWSKRASLAFGWRAPCSQL